MTVYFKNPINFKYVAIALFLLAMSLPLFDCGGGDDEISRALRDQHRRMRFTPIEIVK